MTIPIDDSFELIKEKVSIKKQNVAELSKQLEDVTQDLETLTRVS